MKILFKHLLINTVITAIILIAADYICFKTEAKKYKKQCETSAGIFKYELKHFALPGPSVIYEKSFRPTEKGNGKAILLLGCSYTYGTGIEEGGTFSHILGEETGRTVYNSGIPGGGIQHALYLTQDKTFAEKYKDIDTVIYTYMDDHINRLNEFIKCEIYSPYVNLRLVKKNDEYVKPNELYRYPSSIFLFRMFLKEITKIKNSRIFYDDNVRNFTEMMNETKRNIKRHYPKSRFIVLDYNNNIPEVLKENADKDIIIIKVDELTKENIYSGRYVHDFDCHPTEAVWKELVPAVVKKLDLK